METILDPGSPLRASTPIVEEGEEQIFLEDTLTLKQTQGDSEEEGERRDRNLEICLRLEATMLEDRARKALHATWQEARAMEEEAAR